MNAPIKPPPGKIGDVRLELRPMIAYRGEPPAAHRRGTSCNSFYSFWYMEEESVEIRFEEGNAHLQAGHWILVPPFLKKWQNFKPGARLISVGFEATWTGRIPWMQLHFPLTRKAAWDHKLIRSAKAAALAGAGITISQLQTFPGEFDCTRQAQFLGRLYLFIAELTPLILEAGARIPSSHAADPRIDRLAREIQIQPAIDNLPYNRWRREAGLSRVQIDRLFQKEFGHSPRAHRDRYLLAAIKRRLLTGSNSIKEIAADYRFSDSSHLCRWFRRQASVSPEEFRRHGIG